MPCWTFDFLIVFLGKQQLDDLFTVTCIWQDSSMDLRKCNSNQQLYGLRKKRCWYLHYIKNLQKQKKKVRVRLVKQKQKQKQKQKNMRRITMSTKSFTWEESQSSCPFKTSLKVEILLFECEGSPVVMWPSWAFGRILKGELTKCLHAKLLIGYVCQYRSLILPYNKSQYFTAHLLYEPISFPKPSERLEEFVNKLRLISVKKINLHITRISTVRQ